MMAGMHRNYTVLKSNALQVEEARHTGVLFYTDYEPYYTLQPLFHDSLQTEIFLNYYQLQDVTVFYLHEEGPTLRVKDQEINTIQKGDNIYIPLRAIMELNNGTVQWITDDCLNIQVNNQTYLYQAPKLYSGYRSMDAGEMFVMFHNQYYVSKAALEQFFEIYLD